MHCFAGKNLYNNEHVAVKLVSFIFSFFCVQSVAKIQQL